MIRVAKIEDQKLFNKLAKHPLQSWSWGDFRSKTGVIVWRIVEEDQHGAKEVYQITLHKIPKTKLFIGYCPKSAIPSLEVIEYLKANCKKKSVIFVKFEPNEKVSQASKKDMSLLVPGKSLFTEYSFQLDISRSEEDLLKNLNQKTRYNIRLATKKGVEIVNDDSDEAFEEYWRLMEVTTKRQGFYAHTKSYHQKMWQEMRSAKIAHLFLAKYSGEVLSAWVIFVMNGILYYPYGASDNKHREVMANNLLMWEVIKFGKKQECVLFDMWGSMGPDPDVKDPWYGFHKFKQGYNAELVHFVGTYDLVINTWLYRLYNLGDWLRWKLLKIFKTIK